MAASAYPKRASRRRVGGSPDALRLPARHHRRMESGSRLSFWSSGFADRREAGELLADELRARSVLDSSSPAVVVGLARGGVEVAAEVAARIGAPLDALAVRKVGHPWQPEYGLGAVAPDGTVYLRSSDGLSAEQMEAAVRRAVDEAAALDAALHAARGRLPVEGATCVLVDDGLATGGTMVASARWARAHRASRVVVAVPVGAAATVRAFEESPDVDAIVSLAAAPDFGAVGFWYRDFHQVEDERVISLLDAADRKSVV